MFACHWCWSLSGCVFSFSRDKDKDLKGIYAHACALFADLAVGARCARVYLAYAGGRNNSSCPSSNWNTIRVPIALWSQEKGWTEMVDWGFIIALSIGIALLVISIIWFVRLFRLALPELKRIAKAIGKYLKT